MIQALIGLDICLYLFRRFVFTTFHIKLRNVFITVLVLKACVAIAKAIINYIVSIYKKDSGNKQLAKQNINKSSNQPKLRVVK